MIEPLFPLRFHRTPLLLFLCQQHPDFLLYKMTQRSLYFIINRNHFSSLLLKISLLGRNGGATSIETVYEHLQLFRCIYYFHVDFSVCTSYHVKESPIVIAAFCTTDILGRDSSNNQMPLGVFFKKMIKRSNTFVKKCRFEHCIACCLRRCNFFVSI